METTTCGPHCGHWNDMQELDRLRADNQRLCDKLLKYVSERELAGLLTRDGGDGPVYSIGQTDDAGLRAAVNAYIDAEQEFTRYTVLGTHKRNPDTALELAADVDTAFHALREAVGR